MPIFPTTQFELTDKAVDAAKQYMADHAKDVSEALDELIEELEANPSTTESRDLEMAEAIAMWGDLDTLSVKVPICPSDYDHHSKSFKQGVDCCKRVFNEGFSSNAVRFFGQFTPQDVWVAAYADARRFADDMIIEGHDYPEERIRQLGKVYFYRAVSSLKDFRSNMLQYGVVVEINGN